MDRRTFLAAAPAALAGLPAFGAATGVTLVTDPADAIANSRPAKWATQELESALKGRGIAVERRDSAAQIPSGHLGIVTSGPSSPLLAAAKASVPNTPEGLAIAPSTSAGNPLVLAAGRDERGLVYALLELADRVTNSAGALASLNLRNTIQEQPANRVRAISRLFCSDVEDKPWFNDREMWPRYLTNIATQRFNRFHLALGIGFDFLREVADAYFLFAYPFLIDVPGYKVRATNLPDSERDHNFEMLKFISEQAAERGLEFQLGIWTHGYEWINSPNPNHKIEGITKENHGPYCRDAVKMLLQACPAITGVTFRVHGESGVEEGSYEFWKTVFEGVANCGRKVELDMHAKGMDQTMIDLALSTGQNIKISPKYWAEHMGLPYHQADIRDQEVPKAGRATTSLMKFSAGSRSFLRYGYGDLLREDRKFGVLHRIWPGTQRLLLWGDPVTGAAHSRAFSFCGSDGVDIMEPLSFKGRRGSGLPQDRGGYADANLKPRWDWEKYVYSHRVWGRLLYNPDASPEVWRRYLNKEYGPAAPATETALANSSRILPLITTAHCPSAANNTYWPELYTNQPIVNADRTNPYRDTKAPRVFGNVSPLDPQLFGRVNDFATELLKGERNGKYSPIEVAQWLEDYAATALRSLAQAESVDKAKSRADHRRLAIDVAMEAGIGRFFAAKLRAGVLYGIFEQTKDRTALQEALKAYRKARAAWADIAARAKEVYIPDITIGEKPELRGHWADRLPAIDQDIADMADKLEHTPVTNPDPAARRAIQEALNRPVRQVAACRHSSPRLDPGRPLLIELALDKPVTATLHYRHVTQEERFLSMPMEARGNIQRATIPAAYTKSNYPLEYYFELKDAASAWLYPGFAANMTNQPYFVLRASQTPA